MKQGDDVIYPGIDGDHLAEILKIDRTSGMIQIQFHRRDLIPRTMFVRPELLEVIDWNEALGIKKPFKDDDSCSCGAKYTSNPRFHLRYCNLSKDK
jgi:hypothetical protein